MCTGRYAAGASGFVLKDIPPETLVEAVRIVADGGAMIAPTITRRLIRQFADNMGTRQELAVRLTRLTSREQDVLKVLAAGMNNVEIARHIAHRRRHR